MPYARKPPTLLYVSPCLAFFVTSTSANGKLVVWVGGLDSWDPLMKGNCYLEAPRFESQNNNPNQQSKPPIYINLPLVDTSWGRDHNKSFLGTIEVYSKEAQTNPQRWLQERVPGSRVWHFFGEPGQG